MGAARKGLILVVLGYSLSYLVRFSGASVGLSGVEQPFADYMTGLMTKYGMMTNVLPALTKWIRTLFTLTPLLAVLGGIYYTLKGPEKQ
jgi:hypothetical protein